jgi:sin recombinase
MNEAIGNSSLDKFMKDLIIQIPSYCLEQERNKSKRRQAQDNKTKKEKGVYRERPIIIFFEYKSYTETYYLSSSYRNLEEGKAINEIAKTVEITRQTVYIIKHDKDI